MTSPKKEKAKNKDSDTIFKYGSQDFVKAFCLALKIILDERRRMDARHAKLLKILEKDLKFFSKKVGQDDKNDYQLLVEKSEQILAVLINKNK